MQRVTGTYEPLGQNNHFIPSKLPPTNPPLEFTPQLLDLYGQTMHALGQLNEMTERLPDRERFIKAYVTKEALLSSAIEGIHTTLVELFTESVDHQQINKETQLVLNYTKALDTALHLLVDNDLPLVNRVILAAHAALMEGGGNHACPGEYRPQSVWVGQLTPPPAPQVPNLMRELEVFINEDRSMPPLLKAGLVHVQFETIHPFLDGNGRIGRLLIVLMLTKEGLLKQPILYPSLYFKKHHLEYYQRLDAVRTQGDYEGWLTFYLEAIEQSAVDGWQRAKKIEALEDKLYNKIKDINVIKQRSLALEILNHLFQFPITSVSFLSQSLNKNYNTVATVIEKLVQFNFLTPQETKKRNKIFMFTPYLDILNTD